MNDLGNEVDFASVAIFPALGTVSQVSRACKKLHVSPSNSDCFFAVFAINVFS